MEIEIRAPRSWSDYVQCEEVQRETWQSPNNSDIVPASLLVTANKNGGLLLGAFDRGKMVAFVFGFLGEEGEASSRHLKHCSHMLAVLPSHRGRGLAFELKKRQREILKRQGLDLATWTFDPLQVVNAHLNLTRLGAIARRYVRDAYGEMVDALNAGVPSDRFEAEWWLTTARVDRALAATQHAKPWQVLPGAVAVYEVAFDQVGLARPLEERELRGGLVFVETPVDFARVKDADVELARLWRAWTRGTFERAFAAGFSAVEAGIFAGNDGQARAGYMLERPI